MWGSTHISHIETGMTIPSTKLLVQMMNILDCDPAEVLCMEMRSARPVLNSWLSDLVADCNEDEKNHHGYCHGTEGKPAP